LFSASPAVFYSLYDPAHQFFKDVETGPALAQQGQVPLQGRKEKSENGEKLKKNGLLKLNQG
jgi:hypothetical protein